MGKQQWFLSYLKDSIVYPMLLPPTELNLVRVYSLPTKCITHSVIHGVVRKIKTSVGGGGVSFQFFLQRRCHFEFLYCFWRDWLWYTPNTSLFFTLQCIWTLHLKISIWLLARCRRRVRSATVQVRELVLDVAEGATSGFAPFSWKEKLGRSFSLNTHRRNCCLRIESTMSINFKQTTD